MASVQYLKVSNDAYEPMQPRTGYPGYELRAAADYRILPGASETLQTELIVQIPLGYYGRILPKDGSQNNLTIHRATIHAGEPTYLCVDVTNETKNAMIPVNRGEVIGMLVLHKLENTSLLERNSMNDLVEMGDELLVDVCKVEGSAFVPYHTDDGCIVRSLCDYEIAPGQRQVISTGVAFRFPAGFYGRLELLDYMIWNWQLVLEGDNVPSHSRRELKFIIRNNGPSPYKISAGDKVAVLKAHQGVGVNLLVKPKEELGLVEEVMETGSASGDGGAEASGSGEGPSTSAHGMKTRRRRYPRLREAVYEVMAKKQCVRVSSSVVLKAMVVFENQVPDKALVGRLAKLVEEFVREQCEGLRECDCGRLGCRQCGEGYRRFFASCTREVSDTTVTFHVTLGGECVLESRDGPVLARALEQALGTAMERLSSKFFVKVVNVRGEFTSFV